MSAPTSPPAPVGGASRVRAATLADLPRITELAIAGMDWSPIMDLGPCFVSLIYRHAIRSPHSFCLVAEAEGRVAGFILGSYDSRRWYRTFVLRQGPRAALCLFPKLFVPRHLAAIRRGASYFPQASPEDPPAEILGIVVDQLSKGLGLGNALQHRAMAHYLSRGVRRVKFGDIDVRNAASNALFSKQATLHRTEPVYGGNAVNVYHYDIPPELAEDA